MEIFVGKSEIKATREMLIKPFYENFHDFFIEEDYVKSSSDTDFPEILFSETEGQKYGKEIWVWWRFKKATSYVGNDMMKYIIEADLHGVGITESEIMHAGKRLKVEKGKFEIILRAKLFIDDDAWHSKGFGGEIMALLFDFYKKRRMKKLIEDKKYEILKDLYKFADHVKAYFNLPTQGAIHEPFLRRLGYDDSKLN